LLAALLLPGPRVNALPPAGTDEIYVSGRVSVVSRLGQETIPLTGSATVNRSDPRLENGMEVVDTEIIAMSLTGESVTGPITVSESTTRASTGQIRSLQPPPDQFPASSFFDVFVEVTAPASPSPTITLHNDIAVRLVPTVGGNEVSIQAWPPIGVTYGATPNPCVRLLPSQPKNVCITNLTMTDDLAVGGLAELAEISSPRWGARDRPATGAAVAAGLGAGAAAIVVAVGAAWWARRAFVARR
jgi:hypothetical protein